MTAKRKPRRRFLTGPELPLDGFSVVWGEDCGETIHATVPMSATKARRVQRSRKFAAIYELVPVKLEK